MTRKKIFLLQSPILGAFECYFNIIYKNVLLNNFKYLKNREKIFFSMTPVGRQFFIFFFYFRNNLQKLTKFLKYQFPKFAI